MWTIRCLVGAVLEYAAVHRDLRCLLYAVSDKWANLTHLLPSPVHFNVLSLAETLVSEAANKFNINRKNPSDLVIQKRAWVFLYVCKGPIEAGHNIYIYSGARTPSLLNDS